MATTDGPLAAAADQTSPGGARRSRPGPAGRKSKWVVVACWLLLAVALAPLAQKLTGAETNDNTALLPRSAEATVAVKRAEAAQFPEANTIPAMVVYVRSGGLTAADQAKISGDRAALAHLGLHGTAGPLTTTADGTAELFVIPLDGSTGYSGLPSIVDQMRDRAAAGAAGLQTGVAGLAAAGADTTNAFSGLDTTLLGITVLVVAVILLLTYRSPVLWLVPLITVGVASQLATAVIYLLAEHAGLTVNGQTVAILTVLVFGVGTDYALLLVARYREELRRHQDRHEAMALALRRCVPAILASAGTVVLGMLCLLAAQMNSTRSLGPVVAIGVTMAFLLMVTLLPAVLVCCGRWLFWPFVPGAEADTGVDTDTDHGVWGRVAGFVARRRRPVWIGAVVVLAGLGFGSLTLRAGMSEAESFTGTPPSISAQRLLDTSFPSGAAGPAQIYTTPATAAAVAGAAAGVPGVVSVGTPVTSPNGQWDEIDVMLKADPDTDTAAVMIRGLRSAVRAVPGSQALVGGESATQYDIDNAVDRDNRVVIPLILAAVFLVLVLLLRAITLPVLLMASVVLSFLAALGASSLILAALGRQHADRTLPLIAFLFLVSFGADYTIFLMSRAREETAALGSQAGLVRALAVTGGVITSAGLVLAAAFGVIAVLPLTFLLQLGLIVVVGVLLDTLVVRTLLVPALGLEVGRRIWWPGRLARAGAQAPVEGVMEGAAEGGVR